MLGAPRPGPGGVHDARAEGARRARRRATSSSTRPSSSSTRRARRRSRTTANARSATSRCCASTPPRAPAGKPRRLVLRFCVSPVAILGDERVEAIEVVRNELVADGRADLAPCRPTSTRRSRAGSSSAASATGASRSPGVPFDERARHDPERRAAGVDGRRRRLLRRLDQARPERRDRHEQEGRDRDGRAPARGRARRAAAPRVGGERLEDAARRARRRRRRRTRAGRRSTPHERARRRAARPAARQARAAGTSCSRERAARHARLALQLA